MKNMHFSDSILRYAVLLICFLPMALHAHSAQGKRIILKGQSITMQQAIQLIEENSQYTFFFKSGVITNDEKKDYDCEGDINEVLKKVFSNSGIDYVIKNNEIILKSAKSDETQQPKPGAKKSEIVGVVIDANTGESIIGASVQIKGAATGVITNIDGKFTIMASPSDVIIISYVGYTPKEIKIGSHKVLSIELTEDAKQLEEVVVTAYGTGQKKASMVGSVEAIKPAELKVPSTNLSTAFAGRLAGVVAVQRSGQPGADGANFWIRGVSTMNGVTDPLIILDGIQVSSGDLNNLDPEIIDSFSILKDATATPACWNMTRSRRAARCAGHPCRPSRIFTAAMPTWCNQTRETASTATEKSAMTLLWKCWQCAIPTGIFLRIPHGRHCRQPPRTPAPTT